MPVFSVSKSTYTHIHTFTLTNTLAHRHKQLHTHLGPLKLTDIRQQKLQHGLERTIVCDYCTGHSKKIDRNHIRQKYFGDRNTARYISVVELQFTVIDEHVPWLEEYSHLQ